MSDWVYVYVPAWHWYTRQEGFRLILHIDDKKFIECRFVDFSIKFVFYGHRIRFASYEFDLKNLCYVKNVGIWGKTFGEDEEFVTPPSNPRERYVLDMGL